ncbi:MAG: aegerolysin family protein [Microcoleus sp.]
MAYAQWVSYNLYPKNFEATIKNSKLSWGKFYTWDNKDNELSPERVNGTVIAKKTTAFNVVNACGRSDSPSGTQGSFDIYDGAQLVATLLWDCPWGSKTNSWSVTNQHENYVLQGHGGSQYGGAIGTLDYEIIYAPD